MQSGDLINNNQTQVLSHTLCELLEQQALQTPHAVAIQGVGFQYTYSVFLNASSHFALQLVNRGSLPDGKVGICLSRSFEMVLGIFSILRAGAGYVPVDPSFPDNRIASIFEDAGVNLVVASPDQRARLQSLGFEVVVPEADGSDFNSHELLPVVTDDQVAYVLFTSGSTGTPKGVEIRHTSVVNLVSYIQNRYPIGAGDRVMLKSPYTFDGSVWELFGWLQMGATLFIAPAGAEKDPAQLIDLIKQEQINFMFFVPSMLQAFLDYAEVKNAAADLGSMKWVSVGGEVLPVPLVKQFYQIFDGAKAKLFNVYGPTETTVYATTFLCQPDVDYEKIPIGEAVTNDFIYILDEHLQQVSYGVEGEIFIGGAGVGKGYLNRPELNAERFLCDPFVANGLMYRTGDIGRQIGEDLYDFIGRLDFQVKLRGLRIEMGEVEHALQNLPAVHECVVTFANDRNGDKSLVAYLRLVSDYRLDSGDPFSMAPDELKEQIATQLNQLLPSYMIPAEMVVCQEFPLSNHGKIDRKQLPEVADLCAVGTITGFMPMDETQERVYEIWKKLLGRTTIGAEEDFFSAGGHSLKAVQVITMVMRIFGVELPMKHFYNQLTMMQLAAEIDALQHNSSRELLVPVHHDPTRVEYPLSSAMQELWFVNSLDSSGISRNIQLEFTLKGNPDTAKLSAALKQVIDEESMFRSVFPLVDEMPVQRIMPEGVFLIDFDDVSALNDQKRDLRYRELIAAHGRFRFNLEQLPLLIFKYVRWSSSEHRLLLNIHHLIFDGWSLELFVKRLIDAYNGLQSAPVAKYCAGDYALWQQKNTNQSVYRDEIEFWKKQLEAIPEILTLPLRAGGDRRNASTEGDRFWFTLSAGLTQAIDDCAARLKVTPFAVLTAGFQLVLAAHSSQRDVVVGTPYANRNHPMCDDLIGLFTNMVSIRLKMDDNDTASTLIGRCNVAASEAFSNASVIFSEVVKALVPHRQRGVNPVFQASMVMQNWPGATASTSDFSIAQREIGNGTSKLDLMMNVEKADSEYVCWLEYNTILFDKSLITALAADIDVVYQQITSSPTATVKTILKHLHPGALQRLLLMNQAVAEVPVGGSVHRLFEHQALLLPDKIAVEGNDGSVTYQELDQQACVLADVLIHNGLRAGQPVAVFLNRGVGLITALLAILKAGGAYVPLDPVFPPSRLAMIFEDAAPVLVLTETTLLPYLPATGSPLVLIDQPVTFEIAGGLAMSHLSDQEAAYIIFTSGSTGRPKGVVISHRAVVNFLRSMQVQPGISPDDRLLAVTTVSFDIAGLEIWLPLISGSTLVLSDSTTAGDPVLLADAIVRQGITIMQATPATWQMLTDSGWEGNSRLKILCGGEALSTALAGSLLSRCHELWNMYGPTETTIWSTIHQVVANDLKSDRYIVIGKPIANTFVYVLNNDFLPVTDGYSGELFIGGQGLATGYFNQPELTREKFLPDPFSPVANSLMYRTGDHVRIGSNDTLEFIERIDAQIKIRGFRIEPGDIETALRLHPSVEGVVVVAHNLSDSHKVLVACIRGAEASWAGEPAYREFLRGKIPDYMIPSFFIRYDSFPLTPNGKVDRKALNIGDGLGQETLADDEVLNPTEQKLIDIWRQVLNTNRIRLDDDFFDVGGNSLIAVRLMVNVEKAVGKRLPLAVLFNHGTIRAMARLITGTVVEQAHRSLIPIKTGGARKPLFLIHAAGLNLLLYNTLVRHLHPDQPVYGLQAKGLDGTEEPLDSLEEIAAHYIDEILTVDSDGPYAMAGFCMGGTIAYEMARQLESAGKKVCFVGLFETVAHRIPEVMPPLLVRKFEDGHFLLRQIMWNFLKFLRTPISHQREYFLMKWKWIQRRMSGKREVAAKAIVKETVGGVQQIVNAGVRAANEVALSKYVLRPWNGTVHLFKAKEQTFYIAEPVYYGWKPLATKGVEVIMAEGTHSKIFAPPNDQVFASTLQSILDGCGQEHATNILLQAEISLVVAKGQPTGNDDFFSVAFLGNNEMLGKWWFDQFFPNGYQIEYELPNTIALGDQSLTDRLPGVHLVLADAAVNGAFRGVNHPSWFVPQWVELGMSLKDVDFEVKCSSFRKTRNAIRQAGYVPHWFGKSDAPLDEFYSQMYVPYISQRQGKHVVLSSYAEFSQILADGGQLLMIGRNGQFVAGAIIDDQAVPLVHSIGVVITGDFDHLGHEVIRSLFYFSAIRLQGQGYDQMNLGGCRPLVHDKSLWFKKSIGGVLIPGRVFTGLGVGMYFIRDSEPLRYWLGANPLFVAPDGEAPASVAFCTSSELKHAEFSRSLIHKLQIKGVSDSLIYRFDNPDGGELASTMDLKSYESLFLHG